MPEKVKLDDLDMKNCIGKPYNWANMTVKYKGVQLSILDENKLAYFHFDKVVKVLQELQASHLSTLETKTEANLIVINLTKFEFITFIYFWYTALKRQD
ncbi:hypothetical protein PR048_005625 [Dryococelus australis]|uniref:Uncharacterized protein n=1 Tax=Dryococelus australis TaxID=614101 RepID=A0ABQ9I8R6_9NEOP|nr:hypothetical protein PR048_005625 [Dryococelus australis]